MKYVKQLEVFNKHKTKKAMRMSIVKAVLESFFWYTLGIHFDDFEYLDADLILEDLCICLYLKYKQDSDLGIETFLYELNEESEEKVLKSIENDPSIYSKYKILIDNTYLPIMIPKFIKDSNKYNL